MDLLGNYAPGKGDVPPVKKNARVKKMAEEPPIEKLPMEVEAKRVMPMGTKKVKKVKMAEHHEHKHEPKHEAKEHHEEKESKHMSVHEMMVKNECSPAHVKKACADLKKECMKELSHKMAVLKADMRMKQAENKKEHKMMMKMMKKD